MKKFLERFVMYLAVFTPFMAHLVVKHFDWYPYENQRVMFDGFPEGALFLATLTILGAIYFLYKKLWIFLHNATFEDWAFVLLAYFGIYFLSFSLMGLFASAGW